MNQASDAGDAIPAPLNHPDAFLVFEWDTTQCDTTQKGDEGESGR
ncbi:MAG: hypothetical protein ACRDQZ_03335 [Mycobacteriales bacterium]